MLFDSRDSDCEYCPPLGLHVVSANIWIWVGFRFCFFSPLLFVLKNIPTAVAALLSEDGTATSRKRNPQLLASPPSSFQP